MDIQISRPSRLPQSAQISMGDTQSKRAADIVAERLFEAGCRFAFGIPGGEVLTVVDALEKAGIRVILTKHENCAGFMGEGVMAVTGAPAVLVATIGPGVLNCMNVVANAHQDRVPMIVLTGCVDATEALTYTHQILDHQAVFRPITKQTYRLTADGADIIADRAVTLATEPRAGPVHIDIPIGVADQNSKPARVRRRPSSAPVAPSDSDQMALAQSWLRNSERPIMVAGLDAVADNSSNAIRSFCTKFQIPVITTYKGKGLVSEYDSLSMGGAGLSPLADSILIPLIQRADLIICAGYDPIEMRTGWREIWDPTEVNVIDISAEPNSHYMHQSTVSFIADIGPTLEALQCDVSTRSSWPDGEIAAAKSQLDSAFEAGDSWGPASVIKTCQAAFPDNTLITADSGAHRILLSQMWKCKEPRTFLQSSALCTMGCAVPIAIGAKLADPSRNVIAFTGDAGMLMIVGELATAVELGVNAIIVVFVDASLALIEMKQRQRQLENAAVDFGLHDFAAIGESLGGNGFTVRSEEELEKALGEARLSETFSVIAAVIDHKSYDGRI